MIMYRLVMRRPSYERLKALSPNTPDGEIVLLDGKGRQVEIVVIEKGREVSRQKIDKA